MHLGPIWRASLRNKTGPILIAVQIALTLAVLVNAVFIIQQRIEKINRPTGMDVENIITVFSSGIGEDYDGQAQARLDQPALEAIPGVVAVTSTIQAPLSGSGWGTVMKPSPGEDAPRVNAAQFFVNEHGLETLGLRLESGRAFTEEDIRFPENFNFKPESVIISRAFADELFPDGGALGSAIYDNGDSPSTIIGIVERMHGSWVNWDKLENIFEDRVARVLGRLGVPTADDVNKLSARVQKLSRQVADMSKTGAKKPAARRKKAARKKTTA